MKELQGLRDWINKKRQEDPDWDLPDSTYHFILGMERDLEELAIKLDVDLCIMTIKHVEKEGEMSQSH